MRFAGLIRFAQIYQADSQTDDLALLQAARDHSIEAEEHRSSRTFSTGVDHDGASADYDELSLSVESCGKQIFEVGVRRHPVLAWLALR